MLRDSVLSSEQTSQTERSQQRNMGLDYRSASLDIHSMLHRELWNLHFPIWTRHSFTTDFLLNPTGFGILCFYFHSFQRTFIISFLTSTVIQCSSKSVIIWSPSVYIILKFILVIDFEFYSTVTRKDNIIWLHFFYKVTSV